jgi:hypothetical protein
MRTGTIVSQDASQVIVSVGGQQFPAMYGEGQVYESGQLVVLLRQDATWAVLYAMAGAGPNEVQNPSFELSGTGMPPINWNFADLTNLSQVTVVAGEDLPDGGQFAQVFSDAATSSSYLYSSAIGATAGEQFSLSAYVRGFYDVDAPQTADAALVALWFANASDLYPTTSSADIVVDTFTDVPSGPPFVQLAGVVTAPVTGFLRVALRSTLAINQSLGWDFVVGRRLA